MLPFWAYIIRCSDGSFYTGHTDLLEAERRIKGWRRAKKEALIAGDWSLLSQLSRTALMGGRPSTGSGRTGTGAASGFPSRARA